VRHASVPVMVGDCFIPCDLVVLEMHENTRIPKRLGRPFLATTEVNINVKVFLNV